MLDAREVFDLLFAPSQAPNWWEHLGVKDNKKAKGGFLVDTQSTWLIHQHRDSGRSRARMQNFFSPHAQSCMDRRFDSVGVEERVIELKYDKLIDGALGSSLVWVVGVRPRDITQSDAAAIGLCVTKNAARMSPELTNAFIPAVIAAQRENVHVDLVNGESGDRWPKQSRRARSVAVVAE